jgi:arsenate reductase
MRQQLLAALEPKEQELFMQLLRKFVHLNNEQSRAPFRLNHWARKLGKEVKAHSAGSAPSGRINPIAIETLDRAGIDTSGDHSKSWDAFAGPNAPEMRVVITVCDSAAAERCPYWPGSPVKVHWGYADPSNAPGGEEGKRLAFELTRQAIGYRMLQLLALPLESMGNADLQQALLEISKS